MTTITASKVPQSVELDRDTASVTVQNNGNGVVYVAFASAEVLATENDIKINPNTSVDLEVKPGLRFLCVAGNGVVVITENASTRKAAVMPVASELAAQVDGLFPLRVVYAGDSNTEAAFYSKWEISGILFRSDAKDLAAGTATLTIYSDNTATWSAPGDAPGPRVALSQGFVWFESESADMGGCIYVNMDTVMALATAEGYGLEQTVEPAAFSGHADYSPATWAQILSGQKLAPTAFLGSTGETAAGLLARFPQLWTCDTYGRELPDADRPDHAVVMIGTNDITAIAAGGASYDIDDVKASITAMADYAASIGKSMTLCTVASQTWGAGEFALAQNLQRHVDTLAATNSHVTAAPVFLALRDGDQSDGRSISGAMNGVHYVNKGAYYGGEAIANTLLGIVGAAGRSRFRFAGDDSNLLTNGAMLGTAGVLTGTLATGDVAVDTACSNTLTVAFSKETVAQETPWQVATVSDSEANDTIVMTFDFAEVPAAGVSADIEYLVASGGTFLKGVDAAIHYTDGDTNDVYIHACAIDASAVQLPDGSWTGVLRVPAMSVPSWATAATFEVTAKFAADAVTVLKFRAAGAK